MVLSATSQLTHSLHSKNAVAKKSDSISLLLGYFYLMPLGFINVTDEERESQRKNKSYSNFHTENLESVQIFRSYILFKRMIKT